ncbi:MAG: 30S ribosomal protein S20 [Candidatus Niyogibacteria bacterium]|nr:30S ribosomal protein S20 [Candidatus Niyogibacteria bacterium]
MPILKSAKKALRQSEIRRVRNLQRKRAVQDVLKKIRVLADQNKVNDAMALLPKAYQALDKAAKRNVISKNTAARKKSRLVKRLVKARSK